MSLTPDRAIALKTALYHDAVKHDYVVPGFRVYKLVKGVVTPVPTVGSQARKMIVSFQERNKLKVTGEFDTATQNKLIPVVPKPVLSPGEKIAAKAHELTNLAPRHYTQNRPTATTVAEFELNGSDCSGVAMMCLSAAIVGFDTGFGNTWTLIADGQHVSVAAPGDLVFYGPRAGDPEHVTIYVGDGLVVSHGHEGGPLILGIDYRSDRIDIRRYVA